MIFKRPPLPHEGDLRLDPEVRAGIEARRAQPFSVEAMLAQMRDGSRSVAGRVLVFVITLAAAVICTLPFLFLTGAELGVTLSAFLNGSLGSKFAFAETLVQMIPLLIAGMAVAISFHGGLFNMGVEGQLIFGGLVAGVIGATVEAPPLVLSVLVLLGGVLGGALAALVPALLKAYRGVHEVVTTIMMNFVATYFAIYAVAPAGPFVAATQPSATEKIPRDARLPMVWDGTRLHAGVIIALVAVVGLWWLLYRTPLGFRIRLMGKNAGAARASGVSVKRTIITTLLISGGFGGLAGAVQVLGVYGRFFDAFSAGYGWDAIAVALLAALSPFALIVSAFFFAMLDSGAVQMQAVAGVSREMVGVVSGLVVAFVAIQPWLLHGLDRMRSRRRSRRDSAPAASAPLTDTGDAT
ncbi:ABC transporter permease [Pseudooceanicola sp. 200-1SW]|uniref:ABC transporter permease n=1 Tax=Pseudooceanicola sp. 200-1SW TaxID=3425949 RepID=UPI003D7F818D